MGQTTLAVKAYAKINLALDVLYKREDGYHQVEMIMQAIDLADTVHLYRQEREITVEATSPGLACDNTNLAYKAANLLKSTFKIGRGVHIMLDKKIPIAAGLAGGSADAAGVLKGLNTLWDLKLTMMELEKFGASLGSDVPFCLRGGTMLATGRGEILMPLPDLPVCYVVLAKPQASVSTAWVYGQYKPENAGRHPDTAGMIECLKRSDCAGVVTRICNVLESVTMTPHPEISELKEYMLKYGAMNSLMSGSGPTVFGLVPSRAAAHTIAEQLKSHRLFSSAQIVVAKTLARVE
jgi:4-diphosphocytidyl-2-C-methyl-D-erythritol kinase